MSKNLIYYSIGGNYEYIEILKIHLESLSKFIDIDVDFLFITSSEFEYKIRNMLDQLNLKNIAYNFFITDTSSIKNASASKLKIYDWALINNYDKIFYCDIDTIWTDNISNIFEAMKNKEDIYISNEEGLMGRCYYSGKDFFSNEELEDIKTKNIKPINFGVFGFFVNNVSIFRQIEKFMKDNISKLNACIEQPYGNVVLYRNGIINSSFNEFVSHDRKTIKTLMHFPGGPGNFKDKIENMRKQFYYFKPH